MGHHTFGHDPFSFTKVPDKMIQPSCIPMWSNVIYLEEPLDGTAHIQKPFWLQMEPLLKVQKPDILTIKSLVGGAQG